MEKLLKWGGGCTIASVLIAGFALIAGVAVVAAVIYGFFAVLLSWLAGVSPESVPSTIHGMPASGFITATFHDPDYYNMFGVEHQGVDIANSLATSLHSTVENGVVSRVGYDGGGYGFYVVIEDTATGWTTLCGHLLAPGVVEGQTVGWGDIIGLMGSTGNSTGVHVHYEVRTPDGERVDPALSSGCCGY